MRTRITVVLLLAAAALTACGSSSHPDPAPAATTAAPTTPAPSKAALIQACADAITAGKDTGDGTPECTSLPTADYYEALHQANEKALGKFNDATDAGASATP